MNEVIKHSNIIFMPTISKLGGIETYVYELVKKYHYLDIAVVCKRCDETQKIRLRKYCNVYIHTDQQIECDVAIINYDQSIINYINKTARIYQTIHADYSNPIYSRMPLYNPRIEQYIAITDFLKEKMEKILHTNNVMLSYNPLTIEEKQTIVIVSATRLHSHKGPDRMLKLAKALDKAKVNYIWFVITNDIGAICHPNVIVIPNRLDIDKFLSMATYVCLLSDSEACSYTLNESLYRNIPIITTPLPYLKEIGVEDGKNAYIVNFDCSNVDDVAKRITNVPKFSFKKLEDKYASIFFNKKSYYEEERNMKVKVQCIRNYYDMDEDERKVTSTDIPYENPEKHPNRCTWITTKERAEHLELKGLVKIVEIIKDSEEVQRAVVPKTKVEKSKRK